MTAAELTLLEMVGDMCCVWAPRGFQPDRASRCFAGQLISRPLNTRDGYIYFTSKWQIKKKDKYQQALLCL